jgi:hypothetical protein
MEIRAYAQEVSEAIEGAERVEPGSNLAPLAAVREALRKHDPNKSLEDVDAECARGAQFATSSNVALQCSLGAVVDVDTFKTKLHVGLVKRADNFDLKALLKFRAPPEQSGGDAAPAEA